MRWVEADRCRLRQVGMGEEGRGGLRGGGDECRGGPNPVDGAGRARYAARIVGRPEGFGEAGLPDLAVRAMRLWRRRAERDRVVAARAALAQAVLSQVALCCK